MIHPAEENVDNNPWEVEILCACGCGSTFREPKRTGRPRSYLDRRHARRQSMRNTRRRRRDGEAVNLSNTQCRRYRAQNSAEAERALDKHCSYGNPGHLLCSLATAHTSLRCPAALYKDLYGDQRLCIVYATLFDDMMALKVPDWRRRNTTDDGRWLSDGERAEAMTPKPVESLNPWDDPAVYAVDSGGAV